MSDLKFVDTHNLVAFLEKPTESEGFEEIVDFLNANPIKYALTVNPTVYCSCIKQFWDTVKAKTVNREVQLQALVDKKKVIITESTIRRDLQLEDAEEPMADETENVESVPTHSNDLLLSGEDSLKLNELMELCTNLQKKVLDLETTKTIQELEIDSLKRRVKKLEKKQKSRTHKLKRLYKVGLNVDDDITLDSTHFDIDPDMFGVHDLHGDEVFVETQKAYDFNRDQSCKTQSQAVMIQEPSETITTTITPAVSKPSYDKVKAKMTESKKPLKKKDQIMMDADRLLAERLQAREQEELTDEEKARLFVELLEKRKKHFAALRAQEKRNKPPTKAQKKSTMSTYLKHMAGYK
ncbi:hypothetical protein Tco_0115213 [Tanacetum coccineum]